MAEYDLEPGPLEMGWRRLDGTFVGHSEEHLVFETPAAELLRVGDVLYGMVWGARTSLRLALIVVSVRPRRARGRQ